MPVFISESHPKYYWIRELFNSLLSHGLNLYHAAPPLKTILSNNDVFGVFPICSCCRLWGPYLAHTFGPNRKCRVQRVHSYSKGIQIHLRQWQQRDTPVSCAQVTPLIHRCVFGWTCNNQRYTYCQTYWIYTIFKELLIYCMLYGATTITWKLSYTASKMCVAPKKPPIFNPLCFTHI